MEDRALDAINSDGLNLNHKVSFKQLWEAMFGKNGFQHTVLVHQPDSTAVVYGYDKKMSHYIGLLQETGERLNIDAVKKRYLLPERPYTFVNKAGETFEGQNNRKTMQIPQRPFNKFQT